MENKNVIAQSDELHKPEQSGTAVSGSVKRQLIILVCGTAVVVLFFLLPENTTWVREKVIGYWNDFVVQRKHLAVEERKAKRFTTEYTYSKEIANLVAAKGIKKDVLVLIPSAAYFKKYGLDYPVPEPITFYYFTNLKTVRTADSTAINANLYVTVHEKKIGIDSVISVTQLKDSITAFKKYD